MTKKSSGLSTVRSIDLCTPGIGESLWGDLSACNAQAGSPLYENP